MKRKGKLIIAAVLAVVLCCYLGSYAWCRHKKMLLHTECVLNKEFKGRGHMIDVRSSDSGMGRFIGYFYWPLRELEALYYEYRISWH